MCLGVPVQVMHINKQDRAVVIINNIEVVVNTALVPDVSVGDFLMIHAGFAIEKVSLEAAEESIAVWQEFIKHV